MTPPDPREVYRLWCTSYKGANRNLYVKARIESGLSVHAWAALRDQGRSLTALDRKFKVAEVGHDEVKP